jgi:catechol 2,3-dioxygenase-like lactoylglutathione lyase family enzyme
MLPSIHHIGYVVEDLRSGVERFAASFGAGPFFGMEHIAFEEVTFHGGEAVYDHSSAFGQWGPIIVELTEVHAAHPAGLRDALTAPGAGVGHVAWLADSLTEETERLQAAGLEPFHTGRTGPASAVWFAGGALLGHPVEVLERNDTLLGFYELVREAAAGWDGRDPLRILTGPPA